MKKELVTLTPLLTELFDIAFLSIKKPSKSRCGDHLSIEFLDNESTLIAMVCDGVGSRSADYLASEMVCSNWSNYFKKTQGTIPERIKKATLAVNEDLLTVEDAKKGLMTTQTLVVYDISNQHIYIQNVGDSRTYIQRKSELIQATEDDAKSIVVKDRSGKPLKTKDGFVLTAMGINNAIGQVGVKLNVKTILPDDAKLVRGFVLVSDGFYSCPDFEQDALNILCTTNMQEALNVVMKKNLDHQQDDMTAVFIRQKTENLLNDKNIFTFLKESSQEEIFNEYNSVEIAKYILAELEANLKDPKNDNTAMDLLHVIDKLSIDFGRKKYIQLYDLFKENNVRNDDVARALIQKIRSSKNP
ncbi:MAG TPA: protein serine/threonine phosphatase 2C family protein [Bacteroidales bacterium]|nr:protein serine/threonine phosphatase 2C family protein [Bacteroidales bacterium]